MVVLLITNLVLIVFDWLYSYEAIERFFDRNLAGFSNWYGELIHPRFILVDLAFVAVFLLDFIVGWTVAVVRKSYHRWFFYPFVHWYDLLGCIPVSGFRFLRLLRVVTLVYRLHRSGAVDLSDTAIARTARKYYAVAVEEVTDRVTLRMISDLQQEVRSGGPLVDKILSDVVRPRQPELSAWISERIRVAVRANLDRYERKLDAYLRVRVDEALSRNREFSQLRRVPMIGPSVTKTIERTITQMVSEVSHGILEDLASPGNRELVSEATNLSFEAVLAPEEDEELNRMVIETVDRSLDLVKQQVAIQQWKIRDLAGDEEDLKRRLREELNRMEAR
jgi:hypothetical protein